MAGKPLTSFAKAGESSFKSEKPAKPFGAPESDAEDGSNNEAEGDDGSASESGEKEEKEESDKEELKAGDDKKRTKLQKSECRARAMSRCLANWTQSLSMTARPVRPQ